MSETATPAQTAGTYTNGCSNCYVQVNKSAASATGRFTTLNTATAIPTLSEWGAIVLGLFLAVTMMLARKRQQAA